MSEGTKPLLVVILGPTASGKSELAVGLCRFRDGEIVNCDSMQMVRFLDIGTAKPSQAQRSEVPHHLFDLIDPHEHYSAGRYMVAARQVVWQVAARSHLPVVVGGTGLYLRAFLEGVFPGPGRSVEIRERLGAIAERRGRPFLHKLLERKDPEAARRIAPTDLSRVVRALEVYFLTGRAMSRWQPRRQPLRGFRILKFGLRLPRAVLYGRIDRRVERMFSSGFLEEVDQLLVRGWSPEAKGFEALGYREAVQVLKRQLTLQEAIERTQQATRRYAKRQMTWFRREPDVHWVEEPGEDPALLQEVLQIMDRMDAESAHGL